MGGWEANGYQRLGLGLKIWRALGSYWAEDTNFLLNRSNFVRETMQCGGYG